MSDRKQVLDLRSTTSKISKIESDDLQRNWIAKDWDTLSKDLISHFDPTRASLNFEVVRGGIVQPIDRSKSVDERMQENLSARGIKDPYANPNAVMKRRILAQFIFGGNRARMHEIAFGMQKVDLTKGADNSHVTRSKDIEEWAMDVYEFVAQKYGEQNIICFYVHLDEMNPHAHCILVPIHPIKNRISWTAVFGWGRVAESISMNNLHTEFERSVGQKWGLERGSNMDDIQKKSRSAEEFKRDLVREIAQFHQENSELLKEVRRNEIKLKGITTMIENLRDRRRKVEGEIKQVSARLEDDEQDDDLQELITALREEMEDVDEKLDVRIRDLNDVKQALIDSDKKLQEIKERHNLIKRYADKNTMSEIANIQKRILYTFYNFIITHVKNLQPSLIYTQGEALKKYSFYHLTEPKDQILNASVMYAMGYSRKAVDYIVSCGGLADYTELRHRDTETDEQWWQRCITQATVLLNPKE